MTVHPATCSSSNIRQADDDDDDDGDSTQARQRRFTVNPDQDESKSVMSSHSSQKVGNGADTRPVSSEQIVDQNRKTIPVTITGEIEKED